MINTAFRTHPFGTVRAAELQRWVQSGEYDKIVVQSTIGEAEERYKIQLLIELSGRRIRASFTLANRSRQVYPVLVGRNVLSGKFIVDVSIGEAHVKKQTVDQPQTKHNR